jgi:tRNA threonylcarbamoyladenosine modification (KEOPS) complex  Pcc1 subunit
MKRRWRVVLLRNKGEILGEVEAPDVASAKAAAAHQSLASRRGLHLMARRPAR